MVCLSVRLYITMTTVYTICVHLSVHVAIRLIIYPTMFLIGASLSIIELSVFYSNKVHCLCS